MAGIIGYTKAAIDTLLAQLAQDSAVVHLANAETITGAKTFSVSPTVPTPAAGTGGASAAVPRSYVDGLSIPSDALLMHLAGAETVTGVKTFTAPPVVPSPTGSTQAAPKSYVDAQIASVIASGGTSSPFPPLGYYAAGLTASTQAGATANSNAIAKANSTALQNAVNSCPQGQPIFIPAVPNGQAYYFASPVTITRSGISLIGSGTTFMSDLSTGTDGGSCLKDIPGFTGAAVIILDSTYHVTLDHLLIIAGTTQAAVLDNGNGTVLSFCGIVGGSQAAYDCRNGTQAPYNLTMTGNQNAHRMNMMHCQVVGLSSSAGSYCCYWSVDSVITGGRYNTGTKCLLGSGIVITGGHFTGGSPNIDCQDTRNFITGAQFDGASDVAMVRTNGNLTLNGCLFYQSVSSNPNGPIPMVLVQGVTGPKINGGLLSSNAGSPAFSSLLKYTGGAGAVLATHIIGFEGASSGNVTALWDANGAPGLYSVFDGTTWHTSANATR